MWPRYDRPLAFGTYRDTSNENTADTITYLRERVRVLHARVKELEGRDQAYQVLTEIRELLRRKNEQHLQLNS